MKNKSGAERLYDAISVEVISNQWHDISDELPKQHKELLLAIDLRENDEGFIFATGVFSDNGFMIYDDNLKDAEVSYYMYIPEIPKYYLE